MRGLNDPVWISGIVEAKVLTEPPVGEGTQVERVAAFLGKRIQYVLEIVQWTPQSLMAMRSIKGPFPMEVSYEFEDSPDGGPEPGTCHRQCHLQCRGHQNEGPTHVTAGGAGSVVEERGWLKA